MQTSPACPGFRASASPGGRALGSASRKAHHLLQHAMALPYCQAVVVT